MNCRQVHLDFHTSEYIPHVARDFKKEEFAQTLEDAFVNSVTCFARCHHGWLYYPSKKFPHLVHPNLENKNLLLEQIKACHKRNIRVPIYTTVQWDAVVMREHPEWLCRDENGNFVDTQHRPEPHFYNSICVNSPYRQFFKDHITDVIDVVGAEHVDGFFMDIVFQTDCACPHCQASMKELGMDVNSQEQRMAFSLQMLEEFMAEITQFVQQQVPGATVFYNNAHVCPKYKTAYQAYTHLELESLPSGNWGYEHFPITSRYARTLGKEFLGMTGKFHTQWGDFHSLKNQAALEFECFQTLAYGGGCSVGDQLHPFGKLSDGSYQVIGNVFESMAKKEKYCQGTQAVKQIAVLNPETYYEAGHSISIHPSTLGLCRMLQELSYPFDVIDDTAKFSDYELVILPDIIAYHPDLETLLRDYISQGGKVIGAHKACLPLDGSPNIYGVEFLGISPYDREFVMANDTIGKSLSHEEFVMYEPGFDVKPAGATVLMDKIKPFFNREGKTFCSHQHAPSSGVVSYPEVTQMGNVLYFAHPIFQLYRKNCANWCLEMLKDGLELLLPNKLVDHNGPSSVVTSLMEKDNQYLLHILHYIPEKRSDDIYTILDVIPLFSQKYRIYIGEKVLKSVKLVPEEKALDFTVEGGYATFEVAEIHGHAMVLLEF